MQHSMSKRNTLQLFHFFQLANIKNGNWGQKWEQPCVCIPENMPINVFLGSHKGNYNNLSLMLQKHAESSLVPVVKQNTWILQCI